MARRFEFVENVDLRDFEGAYADLMHAAFDMPVLEARKLLRRKHSDNPFGASFAGLVFDDDELVAMNLFWKWEFARGSEVLRAAESCDSAVRPEYRGRGLFTQLQKFSMENIGPDIIRFGFPQENSAPGLMKAGWTLLDSYRKFIYIRRPVRFASLRVASKMKDFVPIVRLDERVAMPESSVLDALFRRARADSAFWRTNFNAQLVGWRMSLNPSLRIAPLTRQESVYGAVIYTLSHLAREPSYRLLTVVDVVLDGSTDSNEVDHELAALMRDENVSEIQYQATRAMPVLTKLGLNVYRHVGKLMVHPTYGWTEARAVSDFDRTFQLTAFDTDHL